jgi:hypothetical protein
MTRIAIAAGALCAFVACARDEPARLAVTTPAENAALGGEVAARVGTQVIPISVVVRVAEAQQISAIAAARKIVDDEIVATAARTRGLDQRVPLSWSLVAARGRFAADHLLEDAKRRGLPNDDEIKLLSEKHWLEVDRPPAARVIHAIVLAPKDVALKEQARRLADAIQRAVRSATNDEFEAKAKAAPGQLALGGGPPLDPKLEVRVERLPAFTQRGWVTEGGGGRMDETFARGAFGLAAGDTSEVIETGFGMHVIRLLEHVPEKRMPFEQRRLAFAEEVYSLRSRDLLGARVQALRAEHAVAVSPAAEQLMRSVALERPEATP